MATIRCKGLTGVVFDVTVTLGTTTMNGLTALAQAIEGAPITTGMYAEIRAYKDQAINQTNDGAKTLTAAGIEEGYTEVCIPLNLFIFYKSFYITFSFSNNCSMSFLLYFHFIIGLIFQILMLLFFLSC